MPVRDGYFLASRWRLPHSSASVAPIQPSVPAMALANLASRVLFSGVSSQVQYERAVRCDRLKAVGASIGPVSSVGTPGGDTGNEKRRSSVEPDNLGRDSKRRMTGCARARGDFETPWVEGDLGPDVRDMGGRSVVLVVGVVMDGMGGSVLLLREKRPAKGVRFDVVSGKDRRASVKYAEALKSSSVLWMQGCVSEYMTLSIWRGTL